MSKFMYNGKPYGGSTNYASSVVCTDAEGNESTVQAEIDKNRDDIDELNKNKQNILKWGRMDVTFNAGGDYNTNISALEKTIVAAHILNEYADISICIIDNNFIFHSNTLKNTTAVISYAYY